MYNIKEVCIHAPCTYALMYIPEESINFLRFDVQRFNEASSMNKHLYT